MSISTELIPEIWSASILRNFEKTSVFADVLNRDYVSDLSTGNKVRIPRIAPVEARTYAEGTPIIYDDIQASTTLLELTEQRYFAIRAGDISVVQANAPFLQAATKNASYALRDTVDTYCADILADNAGIEMGSVTTPISVSTQATGVVADIAQAFNEKNVPAQGRWLAIPPWFYKKLVLDGINLGGTIDTSKIYADGFLGRLQGFDLYLSNNLPKDRDAYSLLAGTKESGSLVLQIEKIEELRDPNSFSTLVRGLSVYGAAVTQPDALACVICEDAAA